MPAYGFFIRHVKGLQITNVDVTYLKDDQRPAFALEDVKGADFSLVRARHAQSVPSFVVKDVEDFTLFHSGALPDTHIAKAHEQSISEKSSATKPAALRP